MPGDPFSLAGKVALVTGANSGIGRTLALALRDAGARVAIGGRRGDRNAAVLDQLGPPSVAFELDVCDAGSEEVGAYERLIGAALQGDHSLFAREDGVLEAWRIVDPLLRLPLRVAPQEYEPGSSGPAAADRLVAASGGWRSIHDDLGPC